MAWCIHIRCRATSMVNIKTEEKKILFITCLFGIELKCVCIENILAERKENNRDLFQTLVDVVLKDVPIFIVS